MKIHTVELWPGAPELHEVVLHSEHIQALARVEAERDAMEIMVAMLEDKEWAEHASKGPVSSRLETCITTLMNELSEANERADEATVSGMTYAEKHDTAQAQLAETVRLLRKIEQRMYGEDVEHRFTDLLPDLDRITAQVEQQEARCPSCDDTGDVHRPDGEWLGECPCAEAQESQDAQAGEFQREDRYIVIKRKDLEAFPLAVRESLGIALFQLSKHLPKRECLVVESDWPEYEPTWAAIQARVEGRADLAAQPALPEVQ